MFWALALILLALAGFPLVVLRRRRPDQASPARVDLEQIKGFAYVGAAALVLLAGTVVGLGLAKQGSGIAEAVAVLGIFAYVIYLAAAAVVSYAARGRTAVRG
ncbi:MAG TPA: hypothetical protein VIT20_10915 [Propionibacteriaceae bacterium]